MSLGISLLLVVSGLALLVLGAEALVRGAASLGKRFGIAEIVIGLTIVAFGTSTPELAVNTLASMDGKNDIVFGNIIGSNLFNLLFILGVSGLIYPLTVQWNTVWKEIPFSLLVTLSLLFLVNDTWDGVSATCMLSRNDGLVLVLLFAIFLTYILGIARLDTDEEHHTKEYSLASSLLFVTGGLGLLALGARLSLNGAVAMGRLLNVSEKFIGCTIVAAGTSLPELATSSVAAYRRHSDIAVGNVVGSNIFNILWILGLSAVIRPAQYQNSFNIDMTALIGATLVLFLVMFTGQKHHLDRWEALLLIMGYAGYTGYLLYFR
ncbi:MAG: calcium/sodium antiporter [Sedimentisphaerales bacterium]|jgi:cation:H+ antiporter|nr:calcium/sodium antiporter [Sedimentisphaerales bacterium]HNY79915.1 calcium/sodium antiporter [Sedimentisphaerales bacterium]HOC65014.1 calcium/sodium antiporter [Sedimentisphaerales bacterium]HOH63277.1 calcium/sodium antiporter [Sedimentisphaerales bacterium]HPY49271.1 calcium/sodium antiporter [Sedimentisphaerales bacterium]